LEADATNGNDPLTIGETALDLTVEDASQGFRRILDRYRIHANLQVGRDFQVLRVYLGNSMETTTTGGGYTYTLRHRVRYAKEMDVLIDSRAPVLRNILEWCETVAGPHGNKLFFQTSSRSYFLNLQTLLKEYGYEIYDPLDLRMLPKLRQQLLGEAVVESNTNSGNTSTSNHPNKRSQHATTATVTPQPISRKDTMDVIRPSANLWQKWLLRGGQDTSDKLMEEEEWQDHGSFLRETFQNLVQSTTAPHTDAGTTPGVTDKGTNGDDTNNQTTSIHHGTSKPPSAETPHDMLRLVARLARLPRLVHMETTAQTVNAVEAMLAAGEVDASNCCALLDRHEGVAVLEATMQHRSGFVQSHRFQWQKAAAASGTSSGGSSSDSRSVSVATEQQGDEQDDGKDDTTTSPTSGLRIICSSTIHDDMFRKVRYWARQGYSAREIQRELDTQYQEILQQSHSVQKQVAKDVDKEEKAAKEAASGTPESSDHDEEETVAQKENDGPGHVPTDADEVEPPSSAGSGSTSRNSDETKNTS
jgi:hypothetical protein